jgi:exopolyphosphatase / guanosine-5'-triphosphate,3'-diphosphate pyrophosphatase
VRAVMDVGRARSVIGLAGTVTALSAMQLGLTQYDSAKTHHSHLTRAQVEAQFARLCAATLAERRRLLAEPARAEVIVGGAAVLSIIMKELAIGELTVSERDILDGLAASLAGATPLGRSR